MPKVTMKKYKQSLYFFIYRGPERIMLRMIRISKPRVIKQNVSPYRALFLFSSSCLSKHSLPRIRRKQKRLPPGGAFCSYRGPERIRTAVAAFAELSLATRPQDLLK